MVVHLLGMAVVGSWAAALSYSDLRERKLPNQLTVGGGLVFLAARLAWGGPGLLLSGLAGASVAALFLLLPFVLRGAGGGDVKMLAAAGAVVGWGHPVVRLLWFTSLAGLAIGIFMLGTRRLNGARVKHLFRTLVDIRYDREKAAKTLPPKESGTVRVPFGLAIAIGLLLCMSVGVFAR